MMLISPQTMSTKKLIKMPMLCLIVCSSMMSAISMIMIKMLGELVASATWRDHWMLNVVMVTLLCVSGLLQLHSLNLAMKFYDQLEVVPIYQTSLMIFWISAGLIILNEKQFYSWAKLFCIIGAVAVCFIGIKLVTMKSKILKIEAVRERADSMTSQVLSSQRRLSQISSRSQVSMTNKGKKPASTSVVTDDTFEKQGAASISNSINDQ